MNTRILAATAAVIGLTIAQGALAQDTRPTSGVTRAQVQAELAQARSQGLLRPGRDYDFPFSPSVSSLTRAEVTADLVAARGAGQLQAGRSYEYPGTDGSVSTASRATVRQELAKARADGELEPGRSYGVTSYTVPRPLRAGRFELIGSSASAKASGS